MKPVIEGMHYSTVGGVEAIVCNHCLTRWKAERAELPENQGFLRQHVHEHVFGPGKPALPSIEGEDIPF